MMFKQLALVMGLTMAAGSGVVAFDYNNSKQSAFGKGQPSVFGNQSQSAFGRQNEAAFSNDPAFGMLLDFENRLARQALDATPGGDARRSTLPTVHTFDAPQTSEYGIATGEEELRRMAPHVPQVQEYLRIEAEKERRGLWARVRHKVTGQDGGGLADIHTRGAEVEDYEEVSPWSLGGMSTLDKYKNREKIGHGLRNSATNTTRQGGGITWKKSRD